MQPTLSICIPTYNRAGLLKDLLECLSVQLTTDISEKVEVVISDNCSTDRTKEVSQCIF
jgi:abequosyltransferase